ncbi:uncharacterized protein LOC111665319 isoform X2 [Seriola lalandi dorsalis]|uniref:uncharacterized protein LOC111665319 isoform X2 n=1 Tax=Seriola lalandi dorsalis TaxID=1841481 RepID=UPI000C6F8426|nr:uncharacterized protein LOC111665319 isoform X2 [Seriola lalandi dorsalis]
MLQTFRKCAAYGLCSLSSLHADHLELQHQITNATRSHHSRLKYVPPPGDQDQDRDRHRPARRSNSGSSLLALTCPSHRKLAATHHRRRITAQSTGLSSDRRLEHTSPGTLHLLFGAPPFHVQLTGPDQTVPDRTRPVGTPRDTHLLQLETKLLNEQRKGPGEDLKCTQTQLWFKVFYLKHHRPSSPLCLDFSLPFPTFYINDITSEHVSKSTENFKLNYYYYDFL